MTFALTSFGSVNPGGWAYSTSTKGDPIWQWFLFSSKNRILKASPSFFDSAATNLLKQAWEVDLSLSQALCFVFCFLGNKKAAWWGGSFVSVVPGAGIEPARPYGHQILSLTCLPIPPSGHQRGQS